MLSAEDRARIAEAVTAAEAQTSGEILCVVTGEVSAYREVPLAWATAAALLLPPLGAAAGLSLGRLPALAAGGGWTAAYAGEGALLTAYVVVQAVLFGLALALAAVPAIRRRLTPRSLKEHRVRQAALRHFAGARLHLPAERAAVLIYASTGDRQIQVLGDEVVHEKLGQAVWDETVAHAVAAIRQGGTAAGLAKAVTLCGEALARHFPPDGAANAAPDEVLEL